VAREIEAAGATRHRALEDIMKTIRAILSTTVLPLDGTYTVTTLDDVAEMNLDGIPHFVGHPSTKAILDSLGAVHTPGLFSGILPGENCLAVSIKQGMSTRGSEGKTVDQHITRDMLSFRLITRASVCIFCNEEAVIQFACGNCGAT